MTGRTLVLRREVLAEFSCDELRAVAGGADSGWTCVVTLCRFSEVAISACGCLTDYCSIDVC